MNNAPRISYTPRPDATPKGEIAVLADVYSFVLRCGEARRAEEERKVGLDHSNRNAPTAVCKTDDPV
jgi:hypothetical protein